MLSGLTRRDCSGDRNGLLSHINETTLFLCVGAIDCRFFFRRYAFDNEQAFSRTGRDQIVTFSIFNKHFLPRFGRLYYG